jgi:hypothetical protein
MTKREAFAREALRALQRYDEVAKLTLVERVHVQFVQEDIGKALGLDCTADDPKAADKSHNSGTCPIHEWLDEGDYSLCHDPSPVIKEGAKQ